MSFLTDLRAVVYDTGNTVPQRFTDAELTALINLALNEMEGWTELVYTVAELDSTAPKPFRSLTLDLSALLTWEADRSNAGRRMKFVTQDTQIDPGNAGRDFNAYLKERTDRFMYKLKKWYGVEDGAMLGVLDQYFETDATA